MDNKWNEIKTFMTKDYELLSPWIMCQDALGDASVLKFVAEGEWNVVNSVMQECGPDGILTHALPDEHLVVPDVPFGALIGKIGGSSAAHKKVETPSDPPVAGEAFAVGAYCVVKRPAEVPGPLFFGLNTFMRPVQVKELTLSIYGRS